MKANIYDSKDKQFYFTITSRNGRIIVTSETYKSKQAAYNGIDALETGFHAGYVSISDHTKKKKK